MTESCVLITAREGHHGPRSQSQSHGEGEGGHFSGSGFIIDAKQGLVATSASWMSNLLQLETSDDTIEQLLMLKIKKAQCPPVLNWKLAPDKSVKFHVLIQECLPRQGLIGKEVQKVVCLEAQLHGIYLMPSVYASLEEQLSSLAQWRSSTDGTSSSTLESVLLPLSCVVLFKCVQYHGNGSLNLHYSNHCLSVGDQITLVGTPFGSYCPEVFLGSASVGCVSKLLGRGGEVFVNDARCLPGCEGAMVLHCTHSDTSSLEVAGMVLTPFFTQKGSPAGLSLACSISAVMEAIRNHAPPLTTLRSTPNIKGSALSSAMSQKIVVAVVTGGNWGSGILVSPRMVLTCGHVVRESKNPLLVKLPALHHPLEFPSNILISTTIPDIALIELKQPVSDPHTLAIVQSTFGSLQDKDMNTTHLSDCILQGNPVFAIGYGLQQPMKFMAPIVTRGIISTISRWKGELIMFMTTAVVHSGMSGGVVVCANTGKPLGIIVGNSEDPETGCVYPDVNYCVPMTWILPPILRYRTTGDFSELEGLLNCSREVMDIWKLRTKYRTIQSKL